MRHSSHGRPDDEEDVEPEDAEEDEGDEEDRPAPRRGRPPRKSRTGPSRPPVRRWRSPTEPEDDEEEMDGAAGAPSKKPPVYWRARDSLFFEPLVALAIVVILLVGLYAYTQNWPPVYVVESKSMQHGSNDILGLLNTGDLVLAQKASLNQITPYVVGLVTGYSTYGEYGDVLLYAPNGDTGATPVIHRALLYLVWNPLDHSYNATDLSGVPCGGPNAVFAYYPPGPFHTPTCVTTNLTGTLELFRIGWNSTDINLTLSAPALGQHSGFVTMGDNNAFPDQTGAAVPFISELVEPGWVIGVARGMIPWFGAVKLLFEGQAGEVPSQSWQFLGLTIVGVILAAFGVHYALRREGVESPLRREEEAEARSEAAAADAGSPRHRWWPRLRKREAEDDTEDAEEEPRPRRHTKTRPPPAHAPPHHGRPKPHVHRPPKPAKKPSSNDDEL